MRRFSLAVLLSGFLAEPAIAAALDALDADGWYSWRVAAAEDAPARCCFTWDDKSPRSGACNLDSRHFNYGPCEGAGATNGFVQIYARIESGNAVQLRALSPECPIESGSAVSDLGEVDVDESFDWLSGQVGSDSRVGEQAIAAIAVHRGEAPLQYLFDAAHGAADGDIRKSAVFWLAQTGATESEEAIMQVITGDPDSDVREEAVFALSQLPGDRAVDALVAVVENRELHLESREDALFWLAQSESDRALAVFERLLADGGSVRD